MLNKLGNYFIISLLSLYFIAAAYANQTSPSNSDIPSDALESRHFHTLPFSGIRVDGPINIHILSNQPKSSIQVRTDTPTLDGMHPTVEDGVLELSLPPLRGRNAMTPVFVDISMPHLNFLQKLGSGNALVSDLNGELSVDVEGYGNVSLQGDNIDLRHLQVDGPAIVTVSRLNSCLLNVSQSGPSIINLEGTAVLQSLDHSGPGSFSLHWVNSSHVRLIARGGGTISLAGVACLLEATLYDHVCLAAKYLRVDQAFVNTDDRAQANVWVRDSLSTLARGSSNIYYYKRPAFMGKYANPPATTLNMVCLPR